MADDVFAALEELGFEKYEEQLREFLVNYSASKEDQAQRRVPFATTKEKQLLNGGGPTHELDREEVKEGANPEEQEANGDQYIENEAAAT